MQPRRLPPKLLRLSAGLLALGVLSTAGSATVHAGTTLTLGPVVASNSTQGQYYFDVTMTNGDSPLEVAAFSFGVMTSDTNVTFVGSYGAVTDPTSTLIGVPESSYIFGDSGLSATDPNFENYSPYASTSTLLIASDFLNTDPSIEPGITLAAQESVGLGRVFFDYNGNGLAASITLDTDPSVTNLVDPNSNSLTGQFQQQGPIGNVYSDDQVVPEPATLVAGFQAALLVGGAYFWGRLRRGAVNGS